MATVTVIQPITATETNKLRVVAYCRVSSSSEDQLNSYQAQLTYYSHKFEESDIEELVDLYADEGITGTCEDKRDEFQRLMKDCGRGKIDRIYTKSISRFARNTRDCLKNIRELKSLGITIFFEKEGIDTANVTDEMMITIMGGLAQEESVSISQNLRWGFEKKMQNGTFILPTAPYGYRMENQKLVICEDEAKIVRFIFSAYLAGYGIHTIKDMLNESEETRLNHSEWKYVSVRYILRNEKYAKINRLQQELKRMTRSDEEDETLDQIEMLADLFEKREYLMTEFEPDVFESIVDRIVVKSRNELEFHLIGGLKFTEMI